MSGIALNNSHSVLVCRFLLPALLLLLAACATPNERPKLSATATAEEKLMEAAWRYQEEDFTGAIALLKPLAEQGDADAQSQYGIMYFYGEGVDLDYGKAAYWFGKSADQGNLMGQTNLGSMHLNGKGMKQNYEEAARLLTLASEQNSGVAQGKLGIMYGEGTGVPKDLVQSYVWLTLAIGNGQEPAQQLRRDLLPYMTDAEIAEAEKRVKAWKPKRP